MGYIRFPLMTVSPTFIAGADQNQPEIRTQSIRGQLRFWYRAYLGALETDTQAIYQRESAIFGNTEQASAVSIQVATKQFTPERSVLMPHRNSQQGPAESVPAKTYFDLRFVFPPNVDYLDDISHITSLFFFLGGLGRRSRRMMGGIQPRSEVTSNQPINENAKSIWWNGWEEIRPDPELFTKVVRHILKKEMYEGKTYADWHGTPSFPTLHPKHSYILIGQQGYRNPEEVNQEFFKVIRSDRYRNHENMFGKAMGGRHASPIIGQVRYLNKEYYPIITAMRSSPLEKDRRVNSDWEIIKSVLGDLQSEFKCKKVWGKGKLS